MLCRWTRGMQRPARTLPHVAPFLQHVIERPATQRVLATEKLQAPWV
jgi:glutathione S-transferase